MSYDQTTGRRATEEAIVVVRDIPCLLSRSKSRRIVRQDGVREMVKPPDSVSFVLYQDITISPGDQAEITPRGGEAETYTINDASLSVGIRMKRWSLDVEHIVIAAPNENNV
jgi:hypothetical protein